MKRQKNVFNILIIILFFLIEIKAQSVPGKIYFENGDALKFYSVGCILGFYADNSRSYLLGSDIFNGILRAKYKGTYRKVPFSSLDYLKINAYELKPAYLKNVTLMVKTKTDISFKVYIKALDRLDKVKIYDELTGEISTIDFIRFVENGKLNIRKIVFD